MNRIRSKQDKSDYEVYCDFMNIEIDGEWLDEVLDELYPNNMYKGLIPTLVFAMEIDQEKDVVWNRILPSINHKVVCPILMCPDDCDFSCTLIVAEVEQTNDSVLWSRIGLDQTTEYNPQKIGSEVEWFDKLPSYKFAKTDYNLMIKNFKMQFEIDKVEWKIRTENYRKEAEASRRQSTKRGWRRNWLKWFSRE